MTDERKTRKVFVTTINFDGDTLDEAITKLTELKCSHPELSDLHISNEYNYSDEREYNVYGARLETDEECEVRLMEAKRQERLKEDYERHQLQMLKAKYNDQP